MSEKHDFENQSDHQFLYENGYYIDSSQKVKKLERLLVECEKLFIKNGKKDVDIMPYPVASLDVLQKNEIIMDFIFSEEIMYNVSRYLDGFPTLVSVDLLRSDPRKNTQEKRFKGSQNWHLDNVTRPFLRVFVYVNDVDNTAGPFSIVSKKLTQRIENEVNYSASANNLGLSDELLEACLDDNDIFTAAGKKGTIIYADTCSCFHCGSRSTEKSRWVFSIAFSTGPKENFRDVIGLDKYLPFSSDDTEIIKLIKNPYYLPKSSIKEHDFNLRSNSRLLG